jgi:hypothetical protein
MKTWVRKTLSVGVLAAGALLFAPAAAQADVHQSTGDNNGILNGTQIAVPVRVPVNIVGNSLGILGVANAHGAGVNFTESAHDVQSTGDNNGILNGTQVYLPVTVPVNVVGNAAAIAGEANAAGVGVNRVRGHKVESARTTEHGWPGSGAGQFTGDNNGILNGTQLYAPITVPINACGNSLAVLGAAYSQAICANDLGGHHHKGGKWKKESGRLGRGAWQSTGDNNGIANGTQLYAPINLPVNLAGNAVALLGQANSRAIAVNESGHPDGIVQSTGDNNGILNGTQIAAPISLPINICGNSLGILGQANAAAACANGGFSGGGWGGGHWDGDGHGHGHGGHGHGGHGHGNGGHGHGGHGNGDNDGDHGDVDDDDYLDDHGAVDDDDNDDKPGYGQGTKPATNAGYGDVKDDKYATDDDDDTKSGGRAAEASPVTGLTETVGGGLGGLALLNTLR